MSRGSSSSRGPSSSGGPSSSRGPSSSGGPSSSRGPSSSGAPSSSHRPSRKQRVPVPGDVRRSLTLLGRVAAMRLLRISPSNYEEVIAPGGMITSSVLTKLQNLLKIDPSKEEPSSS
jgi:hypothetical protein